MSVFGTYLSGVQAMFKRCSSGSSGSSGAQWCSVGVQWSSSGVRWCLSGVQVGVNTYCPFTMKYSITFFCTYAKHLSDTPMDSPSQGKYIPYLVLKPFCWQVMKD